MNNVHVFENIGYQCNTKTDIILKNVLSNYQGFKAEHVNAYVPYLIRHSGSKQYEVGIAQLKAGDTYYLVREKIINSSSDGNAIDINDGEFYIFANEYNFNTAFNNVIVKDKDFNVDNVRTIYIVDTTKGKISAQLPCPKTNPSLIVDFKLINNKLGKLKVYSEEKLLYTLEGLGRYATVASTGKEWVLLQEPVSDKSNSFSSLNYSAQSQSGPGGETGELQYKADATTFSGSNVFFGTNNKLLFGSDSESSANTVLPTSGNVTQDTIFNKQYSNSGNFIIHGTGIDKTFQFSSDGSVGLNMPSGYSVPSSGDVIFFGNQSGSRNLFFSYDGRLGINIPTGSRPQTLAHFVNFACDEGLRIENRTTCNPADITLYHAPATQIIEDNTEIGTLTFSSKDSTQSKTNYGKISSKVLDYTDGSESGQITFAVTSGNSLVNTFITNSNESRISTLANQSALNLNGTSVGLLGENIRFSGDNIDFVSYTGNPNSSVNFFNAYVSNELSVDTLKTVNLASGNLLVIDSSGNVSAANATDNRFNIISAQSGRLLTTASGGLIETEVKISDLFQTNSDIVYSAYPRRPAEGCLNQVVFDLDDLPDQEEFSVGDQIAIENAVPTPMYTTVVSLIKNASDKILSMVTADQITPSTTTGLRVHSISKGFILTLQKYVDPERSSINDSTAIVLSTRPKGQTIFNDSKKPIRFTVNTDAEIPALDIRPSGFSGNVVTTGEYYDYATVEDLVPLRGLISSGNGDGPGIRHNTVNYDYAAAGRWSGLLSTIGTNGKPSSYGTFDQNGNAAEFIANNSSEHRSTDNRYVAGGSITTSGSLFNAFEQLTSTGVASGVGFRLASTYGLVDSFYVTGIAEFDFIGIANPKNISDETSINVYDRSSNTYSQASQPDLGSVSHLYRIGKDEVTNAQYAGFLNAVATGTDIFGIFNSNMETDDTGGILKSGTDPFTYIVKSGHSDKPVTFVSYMNSLRFSNWLHNGAPSGSELTEDPANITEFGAYNITLDAGTTYIINKSRLAKYYIPDIHEWYKSAYFKPDTEQATVANTVLINIEEPPSGMVLSIGGDTFVSGDMTVSGTLISSGLDVTSAEGNKIIQVHNNSDSDVSILNDATTGTDSLSLVDSSHGRLTIGPNPTLQIDSPGNRYEGDYRTGFAPDKVTIASNGEIKIMSTGLVQMSGLALTTLVTEDFQISDPEGNIRDFLAGASGGFLMKAGSALASGVDELSYVDEDKSIVFTGVGVSGLSPLYLNNLQYIKTYDSLVYNEDNIEVNTLLHISDAANLKIGDDSDSLKGSLLVHQGSGPLKFELNKYLEAEGLTFDRFDKRLVEVNVASKRVKFIDPGTTTPIGGIASGLPDIEEDLPNEYKFGDTVAIMHTGNMEVEYVKLAANLSGPFDGPDALYIDHPPLFFEDPDDGDAIFTHICPKILGNVADGEGGEASPFFTGIMYSITRSATLTNGLGYGLFAQDPLAVSGFNCSGSDIYNLDDDQALFSFRPSSKNVLSTRPMEHTHFNAVGENIDFAVYGRTTTLYNRYVPELHNADPANGLLPSGLTAVFKIDANVPNAASGNATGVFNSGFIDALNTIPTGFNLDEIGKVTINTTQPYVITSLSKSIDSEPSGFPTLDVVADLSVNQYTYSSGIITDHIYLSGMHNNEYIPGATLTVDVTGKIISIAPTLPPSVPGPPLNVNGSVGNSSIFLRWGTPRDDGRSQIIDYVIEYSLNDGEIWTTVSDTVINENSLLVAGLVNDQRYIFRVAAVNSIGQGQYSLSSDGLTPSSNVPAEVATLTLNRTAITETDDRIDVRWTPPNNIGASAFTQYIIQYRRQNDVGFVSSRRIALDADTLTLDPETASFSYSLQELGYITTEPHIVVQIFAVNNSGNGSITEKISLGTDPVVVVPVEPPEDEYDFGELVFSGRCGAELVEAEETPTPTPNI